MQSQDGHVPGPAEVSKIVNHDRNFDTNRVQGALPSFISWTCKLVGRRKEACRHDQAVQHIGQQRQSVCQLGRWCTIRNVRDHARELGRVVEECYRSDTPGGWRTEEMYDFVYKITYCL
jgi:hypothetical protein